MRMRRFFRTHRDEDCSQIQYLTAKCNRLSHEKAVLEREYLAASERERNLQNDMEALAMQLCKKEQLYIELRVQHDQLLNRLKHEQGLVEFLQQRVRSVEDEGCREAARLGLQLEQVGSDLQLLQGSETQLEGLVEQLHEEALQSAKKAEGLETQLHKEALQSAKKAEGLETQLHSKTCELEELQSRHVATTQELEEQHSARQRTVQELRHENVGSLRKLRETAEQFEWLCEQQRNWMCCVKRFKDCLSEEKEALVLQVHRLQGELAVLSKSPQTVTQNTEDTSIEHCSRMPSWDADVMADLQVEVDRWRGLYEELFSKLTTHQGERAVDGYRKPP